MCIPVETFTVKNCILTKLTKAAFQYVRIRIQRSVST